MSAPVRRGAELQRPAHRVLPLVLLLLALEFTHFGSPPPNERVVAWMGLSVWLVVPWACWANRHREPVAPATAARGSGEGP